MKKSENPDPEKSENPDVDDTSASGGGRRAFLTLAAGWLVSAGALVTCGVGALRFLVPNVHYGPSPRVLLDLPALYPEGLTFLDEPRIYLLREGNSFRALSGICTHLGCTVSPSGSGTQFRCPCHGSCFDDKGQVLKGPAPRPLPWLAVEQMVDGRLMVDRSREVSENERFLV